MLLNVLVVDDDRGDIEILRRHLDMIEPMEAVVWPARTSSAARQVLAERPIDIAFIDYRLGPECGGTLLQELREAGDSRPLIMFTGNGDEQVAATLIRQGADDYLPKGGLTADTLRRAIDNACAQSERRAAEAHNQALLKELSVAADSLTAKNRRLEELYDTAHQFVDHVAHEFRTPLTVIREFASIMRDGIIGEINGEQFRYLEIIEQRVDDLAVLINDMLDLSKLEAGALGLCRTDCSFSAIVDPIRPMLERRARVANMQLEVNVAADLPTINCDPRKIARVLTNLVINAVKYGGENALIRVDAQAAPGGEDLVVRVSDNGPGISRDRCDAIFERFQQLTGAAHSSADGFGLGLNIAKQLVQLNLGEISVESQIGHGSTFSFTVPVAERTRLVRRFLEQRRDLAQNDCDISILRIELPPETVEAREQIDGIIQRNIRRCDLFFELQPGAWGLLMAGPEADTQAAVHRLRDAVTETRAEQMAPALPELVCEPRGACGLDGDLPAAVERILDALGPGVLHERTTASAGH